MLLEARKVESSVDRGTSSTVASAICTFSRKSIAAIATICNPPMSSTSIA